MTKLKNWNRMQNTLRFGVFYQREEYACMLYMKFDFVRTFHKVKDFGTEHVAYWYQLFMYR